MTIYYIPPCVFKPEQFPSIKWPFLQTWVSNRIFRQRKQCHRYTVDKNTGQSINMATPFFWVDFWIEFS
ncbi:MAG: hypothetical protein DRH32_04545 [Deltaproteobacteria bacterium]|nr:MAG: hypothetical protein DRH32_04545 [Deltaproteobacteria bacterium]